MLKLRTGCFFSFLILRRGGVIPKSRFGPFPSNLTTACGRPITVTVNPHSARIPFASVAVQTTLVTPRGNGEPEGGVQLTVAPGQLSITAGDEKVTTGEQFPAVAVTDILGGQETVIG
jgi:hypothetical protein